MDNLYENIKLRREELKMSQDELAKKMGYKSRSSINKIESGENDIPQSKIVAFAEALGVTPKRLMGWDDHEEQLEKNKNGLIKRITNMSDEEVERVIKIIDLYENK